MKRFARKDDNQDEIVDSLRFIGCTVQSLASIGNGCPDLLVGYKGLNLIFEVKDGSKPPSARKLTEDEAKWHKAWTGTVHVVDSPEMAIAMVIASYFKWTEQGRGSTILIEHLVSNYLKMRDAKKPIAGSVSL